MGYKDCLHAIRKYWWVVLAALLIAIGTGAFVTISSQKLYATTVTFFVQTPSDQLSTAAQGDTFGQKRVNSYVQLVNTDRLLKPVLTETKLPMTVAELSGEVTASGDLNTVLLSVKVVDPSPTQSRLIGASIAKQLVKLVSELESASVGGDSTVRLELVSGPTLLANPVSPRPIVNYGIALLAGLLVGVGIAIMREATDTSVRSSMALEKAAGSAVIGMIAFDETAKLSPLIIDSHAQSIRAEAFRQLRTNLQFIDVDRPAKTVVITSSVPDEGKSSTATNLAVMFAEAGKTVLLVEGDLRRPRVADYLGIEGAVGLTNVLAGQVEIDEALQPWGRGGLTILPSGSIPPNPSELLGSASMGQLLSKMARKFDIIIIDTPPLLPVTDAAVMAAHSDGALLVVRHGETSKQQVTQAAAALKKVDARLLGCVLNMTPVRDGQGDKYGYGYGYGSYANDSTRPHLTIAEVHSAVLTESNVGRHVPTDEARRSAALNTTTG